MRSVISTFGALALLATSAQATSAQATPASRAGVYDSVSLHDETGDLVGTWIRVGDGPRPKISVQLCEGECPEATTVEGRVFGDRLEFDYDPYGAKVMHVTGRFTSKGLWLKYDPSAPAEFVPRAKHPSGPR